MVRLDRQTADTTDSPSRRLYGVFSRGKSAIGGRESVEAMVEASERLQRSSTGLCRYDSNRISLGLGLDIRAGFSQREQPFVSESGTTYMIADADILNARKLRRVLENKGHSFSTSSSAEVILHGFEEWGEGVAERLNGAFAYAIWQEGANALLLARDYSGQRELFYHTSAQCVTFATSLYALMHSPNIRRNIRHESLWKYLALGFVPQPETMVQDVYALPAGYVLHVAEGGRPQLKDWSKVRFTPKIFGSVKEFREDAGNVLKTSVERRVGSGSQSGLFLDGTPGSAALISLGAQFKLPFFSVRCSEGDSQYADFVSRMASASGVPHFDIALSPECVSARLSELSMLSNNPVAGPEVLLRDAVYEVASAHVSGMLSGQAMEESIAGDPRYQREYRSFLIFSRPILRPLASLLTRLGVVYEESDFQRFFSASYLRHHDNLTVDILSSIFREEWVSEFAPKGLAEGFSFFFKHAAAETPLDRTLFAEQRILFPGKYFAVHQALQQRHGIETLCPFTDKQWLEWTAALPLRAKQNVFRGACALRAPFASSFSRLTEQHERERKTRLCFDAIPELEAVIESSSFSDRWFNEESLRACCDSARAGDSNYALLVWRLLAFFQWAECMKLEN